MQGRLTTIDSSGKRLWLYPQSIRGFFTRNRTYVAGFLIVFYLILPWIEIGGKQALLLDVPHRKFFILGSVFWPQDVKLFFLVLALAAFSLFFFTAILGRVWCGWACPQTVFLEFVFRKIETWIEGNRLSRIRLDNGPWSKNKILKKSFKHLIFASISFIVANTFVAYFVGKDNLLEWMFENPFKHWAAFLLMIANFGVFYFNFAWFREQFCTLLCPYARFQSVMTDRDTLQVTYNFRRGEPRGKKGKTEGDCVDCNQCVKVCPTGIDIRDGHQLECIGCARCIDACDRIMEKVGSPKKLISYTSMNMVEEKHKSFFRPRLFVYSFLLIALSSALIYLVSNRALIELSIVRPPGSPYSIVQNELVNNRFNLKLINKEEKTVSVQLGILQNQNEKLVTPFPKIQLEPNSLRKFDIFITAPKTDFEDGSLKTTVFVEKENQILDGVKLILLGPKK